MALREKEKARRATKEGHLSFFLAKTKWRAKKHNLPFDLDLEFLKSIAADECPVFKTPFIWGHGNGVHPYRPSLDKVVPELGYVKYNVAFISFKANAIKQDITEKELYAVADWLHEARKKVLNVKQDTTTSIPEGSYIQGAVGAELGSVSTPWTWEDSNHPDDHSGAVRRQNIDHSAKTGSGDSVGHGSKEMEASIVAKSIEDSWPAEPKIIRVRKRS
jgi:hypothetical protein